tara:strand:+ start:286 stop:549 length:264 start_codon:yes stop_codon:yes gene_type:complete
LIEQLSGLQTSNKSKDDNTTDYKTDFALICPACSRTAGSSRYKVYTSNHQFLIHITTHLNLPDKEKTKLRRYAKNYQKMLKEGMIHA